MCSSQITLIHNSMLFELKATKSTMSSNLGKVSDKFDKYT